MKEANVSAAARKEMAEEKARIMRRKKKGFSLLEQVALAWKKKKEKERRAEQERRVQRGQQTPVISVQKIPAQVKALHNETDGAMQWKQYSPFRKEELEPGRLNEAGIWVAAKSLIAKEWARALGRKTEDPRILALEREAAEYEERKKEQKRRAEQERKRAEEQKKILQDSLEAFGEKLLQEKGSITFEGTAKLFEEALENVGEVVEVSWKEEGCEACIEPWEEKKLRRKRRDSSPVIYKLNINKMLKVVSYERINQGGT
ncbi:MAG: hypothetical protein QMD08_05760 [Actinomycetota bacterium]|nr:hypothetical protein [Actinomycetota bacterium]